MTITRGNLLRAAIAARQSAEHHQQAIGWSLAEDIRHGMTLITCGFQVEHARAAHADMLEYAHLWAEADRIAR